MGLERCVVSNEMMEEGSEKVKTEEGGIEG
jgi:hypothetical protein